jgi:hypothetical protein
VIAIRLVEFSYEDGSRRNVETDEGCRKDTCGIIMQPGHRYRIFPSLKLGGFDVVIRLDCFLFSEIAGYAMMKNLTRIRIVLCIRDYDPYIEN